MLGSLIALKRRHGHERLCLLRLHYRNVGNLKTVTKSYSRKCLHILVRIVYCIQFD